MILTEDERDAQDGKKILLAVNHAGVNNNYGPIVSVGVALDYSKISPNVIETVSDKANFTKEALSELKDAIKAIGTYTISASKLNEIRDLTIATHMADYNALMGLIFDVFKVYGADPDIVQVTLPIKEVVKNPELSIYKNPSSKTNYVVRSDWTQFSNLIPNTKIKVMKKDTFSVLFAYVCANTIVTGELDKATIKYPGYNFYVHGLDDAQVEFLNKNGMTEYHRAFLPVFNGFAFSKRILI